MKLFKSKPADKPKSRSNKAVLLFVILFVACILASTVMVIAEFPWNGNPVIWLKARDLYDQGNRFQQRFLLPEAEAKYRAAIEVYPRDWRLQRALGLTLMQLHKAGEAEPCFRKVVELQAKNVEGWVDLADCLSTQKKDSPDAEEAARKATVIDPTNAVAAAQLAYILFRVGKAEDAEKLFQSTASMEKDSAKYWFISGKYHWGKKDVQHAEADFRQAADLDRGNPEYWEAQGVLLLSQKKFDDAGSALWRAARLNSNEAVYWNNLGDAYRLSDQPDRAIDSYKKAARLDSNKADYQLNLGLTLFFQKKYAEAEAPLRKAVELDPEDNRAWKGYINVLDQSGKYDLAESELRKFIARPANENAAKSWAYLGSIRMKRKDFAAAHEAFDQALSLCKSEEESASVKAALKQLSDLENAGAAKSSVEQNKAVQSVPPDKK